MFWRWTTFGGQKWAVGNSSVQKVNLGLFTCAASLHLFLFLHSANCTFGGFYIQIAWSPAHFTFCSSFKQVVFKIQRIFYIHCCQPCKTLHIFCKIRKEVNATSTEDRLWTQNVQCCSARPKLILPNPKTKQESKVWMLDKLMGQTNQCQVNSLCLKMGVKCPNPLLPTPNPKQNKTRVKQKRSLTKWQKTGCRNT